MLEDKIDKLTASVDRLCAIMEGGTTPAPADKKPAAAAKKEAAAKKPKITADQVKVRFAELKGNPNVGAPPLKNLISELGFSELAELLVSPDHFEQALEGLKALEAEAAASGEEEDEL